MGRGRPPKPGTAEQKAAARRERVRNNVRALRERRKLEASFAKTVPEEVRFDTNGNSYVHRSDSVSDDNSDTTVELLNDGNRSDSFEDNKHAHSTLPLVRHFNGSKMMFPKSIDSKSPYAMALLAAMRQNFLPDSVYLPPATSSHKGKPWESDQALWTPCAFWVTSAFDKTSNQDASLLKTNVLAIGMMLKSIEFQDANLKVAALDMYRRSLQGIRRSLEPLILDKTKRPADSVSLYLSCHAAAMFELILNPDLSATMRHLRGVSQLICHLGDEHDEEGQSTAWLLLQDYRFAEMGLCLKYRYTSFSSIKRRQFEGTAFGPLSISNRTDPVNSSQNVLVKVTDISDQIADIMVKLDSIRLDLDRPDAPMKIHGLLQDLGRIWIGYTDVFQSLMRYCGSNFIYKDKDADGPASGSYKFKTFDVGAAWCFNLMTQCYCLDTMIDAMNLLLDMERNFGSQPSPISPEDQSECEDEVTGSDHVPVSAEKLAELRGKHRKVCVQLTQSVQYFLQTDKGITGQALAILPLDAAICQLAIELSRLTTDLEEAKRTDSNDEHVCEINKNIATIMDARDFCQKMQDRAKDFGLPSFTNAGTEFLDGVQKDKVAFGVSSPSTTDGPDVLPT